MARSASAPASSLAGMRICLSGAVPAGAKPEEGERIRDFVALFAREVFKHGGTIVHGSHPTIRDVLLAEAKRYLESTKHKAPLVLVVSRYYSKNAAGCGIDIPAWNSVCDEPVIETPEVAGVADAPDRPSKATLTLMRRRLADLTKVIVAVGGPPMHPRRACRRRSTWLATTTCPCFSSAGRRPTISPPIRSM